MYTCTHVCPMTIQPATNAGYDKLRCWKMISWYQWFNYKKKLAAILTTLYLMAVSALAI